VNSGRAKTHIYNGIWSSAAKAINVPTQTTGRNDIQKNISIFFTNESGTYDEELSKPIECSRMFMFNLYDLLLLKSLMY